MMFNDPWEELTFRNVGNQGRIFNAVEDRFLLCLTHLHGYGSWDQVRSSIRRCERFRFDFYLQSCSADALGKRCEMLMRAAERELAEIERKKQAADAMTATNARSKDSTDLSKSRMDILIKEIKVESQRLAQARMQLQKLKVKSEAKTAAGTGSSGASTAVKGTEKAVASAVVTKDSGNASTEAATAEVKSVGRKKSSGAPAAVDGEVGASAGATKEVVPRSSTKQVPEGLLPELCK